MPLSLDNVQAVEVKNVTKYKITQIVIAVNEQQIVVMFDLGYEESGDLVKVNNGHMILEGGDFVSIAGVMADGTKNLYDNIKEAVYAKLTEKLGVIGTVE